MAVRKEMVAAVVSLLMVGVLSILLYTAPPSCTCGPIQVPTIYNTTTLTLWKTVTVTKRWEGPVCNYCHASIPEADYRVANFNATYKGLLVKLSPAEVQGKYVMVLFVTNVTKKLLAVHVVVPKDCVEVRNHSELPFLRSYWERKVVEVPSHVVMEANLTEFDWNWGYAIDCPKVIG
ncbi:hypothetical protein EYM_04510 [Ignicoccus islandicus DSM 13165]|uniref:Uncharacterized protein n=2 Tax=Ignicoccus islandicus TaxID=54259 RepID=A0A0U3EDI7_9CREN|nr:hypothetical protein EYM_04510 [Ignicoccus islandicus DSM 13165]